MSVERNDFDQYSPTLLIRGMGHFLRVRDEVGTLWFQVENAENKYLGGVTVYGLESLRALRDVLNMQIAKEEAK